MRRGPTNHKTGKGSGDRESGERIDSLAGCAGTVDRKAGDRVTAMYRFLKKARSAAAPGAIFSAVVLAGSALMPCPAGAALELPASFAPMESPGVLEGPVSAMQALAPRASVERTARPTDRRTVESAPPLPVGQTAQQLSATAGQPKIHLAELTYDPSVRKSSAKSAAPASPEAGEAPTSPAPPKAGSPATTPESGVSFTGDTSVEKIRTAVYTGSLQVVRDSADVAAARNAQIILGGYSSETDILQDNLSMTFGGLGYRFGFESWWGEAMADFDLRLSPQIDLLAAAIGGDRNSVEASVVPMLRLAFRRGERLEPYIEAGVGIIYNDLRGMRLGSSWMFSDNIGFGFAFRRESGRRIGLGYRLRHISHAGLMADDNHGLDTHFLMLWFQ